MRLLLIGDIVGKPGRQIVCRALPGLIAEEGLDLVVANAENAAAGSGMLPEHYQDLIKAGVDCVTLGDHIYRRKEILGLLNGQHKLVKPANYPPDAPGREVVIVTAKNQVRAAVFSLMGRVFMRPVDCPWRAADRILEQLPPDIKVILLDFHAEATSDKQLMGRYLDGRVTAVLGTHTHVPTADEQILPRGTAFQCDVGMTGPYDSILGRQIDRVLLTTRSFTPTHFDVATGDVRLSGTIVELDEDSGKATGIKRLCVTAADAERLAGQPAGRS